MPIKAGAEGQGQLPENLRLSGRYLWAFGHSFERPFIPTGPFTELNFRLNGRYRINREWQLEFAYQLDGLYQPNLELFPPYDDPGSAMKSLLGLDDIIEVHTNWAASHKLDRLCLGWRHDEFTLDIGRQRIAWGTTLAMSFMDMFHPIRPGDPFAPEQPGTDAIRLQIPTGAVSGWDLLYAWIDDEGSEAVASKYHETHGDFESALSAGRINGENFTGFQTTGDINDIGIRVEAAWRDVHNGRKWRLAVESDWAPDEHTYLSGEVFYNGPGATDPMMYDLNELVRGELYPARWYAALNCTYNPGGLSTLGLFGIGNLTDDSWFFDLSVQHSLSNTQDIRIGYQHYEGDLISEYGALPDMIYAITSTYF
jgi:hypothetical protein